MEKHQKTSSPEDKEVVPAEWSNKPIFSAEQLRITPKRTAEDIQRAVAEGRVAEMTPDQAG